MSETQAYSVRTARLIDLDQIVDLWSSLVGHHRALEPRLYETEVHAPASFRAFARRKLDDQDGILLVADYKGSVGGYLLGSVGQRAPVYVVRTVGMVFDLMVDQRLRGQGIGRALVSEATAVFTRRGIMDMQVNYDPNNEEALAFWTALGFKTLLHEAYRRDP